MSGDGPLRIGYLSTCYHTAHILRHDDWHPAGVDVVWSLEMTGPALVTALAAGRLDLAYIGLPPAMIAIARGVPIRCVAGGHEEGTVVVGAADVPIAGTDAVGIEGTLRALAGGTVGIPAAGSIHDVIFRELLRAHGLEGRVAIRNVPQADLITEGLADGTFRGGVGTPALGVAARRFGRGRVVIPPAALWPRNPSYGIVVTDALTAHGEWIGAFLEAHEAASYLIRHRPAEAARRTAEMIVLTDTGFVEETYRLSPRFCAALPEEFVTATLRFRPALERLGYLDRPVAADRIFDRQWIARAHPDPPHYDAPVAS